MSSAHPQFLRTQGTSIGSRYLDPAATPFLPRNPLVTAPFMTEHLQVSPITGTPQPGATVTWELPYEVDLVKAVNLVVRLDRVILGTATFARPADFLGLNLWKEILIRFGTERLQIVRPAEIFYKLFYLMNDEQRACMRAMLRGGIIAVTRSNNSLAGSVLTTIPLLTLLGIHLGGDPSQVLPVRSLNERIRIVVEFTTANRLMETDGGTYSFATGGTPGTPTPPVAEFFTEAYLYVDGKHVANQERLKHNQAAKHEHLMVFREHQYVEHHRIAGATSLAGGSVDVEMGEINQPCVALYVFFRWANDLDRVEGGAGGTGGRNLWNLGGWYNPAGASTAAGLPIISHLEGRAGSNTLWLQKTSVEHLLDYERARCFQGSGIQGGAPALPVISFSHNPSMENACEGFIDFSQCDRPKLRVYFNSEQSLASINAAATADIGVNSDLDVLIIADTISQLNIANAAVIRPVN